MSGSAVKTCAEHQFEAYLREAGVAGHEDHQPDLGGGPGSRRPDYRVTRGEAAAIIELKGFETSSVEDVLVRGGGVVIRDASQELAPVRNKIPDLRRGPGVAAQIMDRRDGRLMLGELHPVELRGISDSNLSKKGTASGPGNSPCSSQRMSER
jgi:hypothetical protein